MYKKFFKRFLDILISFFLLILLLPLIIFLLPIIWLKIGFPIYTQDRPGLHGKIFKLYKLKSLYDECIFKSLNDRRSDFGDFLRRSSLDEIPQLINVLKNDMSLVGPRPLLKEYMNKYSFYQNQRHNVKPGLTGLSQIYPFSSKTKDWNKSLELDVFYVHNISFFLDLRIIFSTIKLVLSGKKRFQDFNTFYSSTEQGINSKIKKKSIT